LLSQGSEEERVYADKQLVISRAHPDSGLSITGAIDYYNADPQNAVLPGILDECGKQAGVTMKVVDLEWGTLSQMGAQPD